MNSIQNSTHSYSTPQGLAAPQPLSLQLLPFEIHKEIIDLLPPWQRQLAYSELASFAHSGKEVRYLKEKLALVLREVPKQYQRAVLRLDEQLQIFAQKQFNALLSSAEPAQVVTKPMLFQLLYLVGEPAVWTKLGERIQSEPAQRQALLTLVENSKKENADQKAKEHAANAITLLSRSGEQFNGKDLRNIKIPGADLSYGQFDHAQLQGAHLTGVKFRNAWLRGTNLSGAHMDGVQFGELPYLQEVRDASVYAYSPDGKRCAVGLSNGDISVYLTSNWNKIWYLLNNPGQPSHNAALFGRLAWSRSAEQRARAT